MWRRRGYDYDQRDYHPHERASGGYAGGGYGPQRGGYDRELRNRYDREMMRRGYEGRERRPSERASVPYRGGPSRGGGGDYWWIGEHEYRRRQGPANYYDEPYRRFSEEHHPRYSPVGGMYPLGGRYAEEGPPPPLRDHMRFSDWTRWF